MYVCAENPIGILLLTRGGKCVRKVCVLYHADYVTQSGYMPHCLWSTGLYPLKTASLLPSQLQKLCHIR